MASTNKTETLELNQWLETDHPKREDFNADNEKIDAFATGIAGAFHPAIPNADTGTWWVWDVAAGDYADTGEPFHGEPGQDGTDGEPGPNTITDTTTTNLTGILMGNGSGITTAIEGEDYAIPPRPFAATLIADDWEQSGDTYTQTVTIPGLSAAANIAHSVTAAPDSILVSGAAGVVAQDVTEAGEMTFIAKQAPTEDIEVRILEVVTHG